MLGEEKIRRKSFVSSICTKNLLNSSKLSSSRQVFENLLIEKVKVRGKLRFPTNRDFYPLSKIGLKKKMYRKFRLRRQFRISLNR